MSPKAADLCAKMFQALTHMGFRETEARRAVTFASAEEGEASLQALLRRALAVLSPERRG